MNFVLFVLLNIQVIQQDVADFVEGIHMLLNFLAVSNQRSQIELNQKLTPLQKSQNLFCTELKGAGRSVADKVSSDERSPDNSSRSFLICRRRRKKFEIIV